MYPFIPKDEILQEFIKIASIFGSTMRGAREQFNKIRISNDLSSNDMRFLHLLHSAKTDLSVQNIADLAGVKSPTISVKIKQLEEKGFIIRERLDDNRRMVKINLSPKSKKLMNQVGVPPLKEFSKSVSKLTKEERDEFLPILKKIVDNMKSELGIDHDIDHPEFMRKMFQNTMEG